MIEFTLSRVVLCISGIVLLVSVAGGLSGIYDMERGSMDDNLVERIGYMLDVFESSNSDELILDGTMILPEGYSLYVHDHFVELSFGYRTHIAETEYGGSFSLQWNEAKRITRRRSRRSS